MFIFPSHSQTTTADHPEVNFYFYVFLLQIFPRMKQKQKRDSQHEMQSSTPQLCCSRGIGEIFLQIHQLLHALTLYDERGKLIQKSCIHVYFFRTVKRQTKCHFSLKGRASFVASRGVSGYLGFKKVPFLGKIPQLGFLVIKIVRMIATLIKMKHYESRV